MKKVTLFLLFWIVTAVPALAQDASTKALLELIQAQEQQLTIPKLAGLGLAKKGAFGPALGVKSMFWRDSHWIAMLGLTADQRKKMDEIFQQYRLRLIDLNAALQKDELILAPMIDALPAGDEAKITAQIDRIAQDRAELEKANSRMLLSLLQTLTPEQWTKLRERKE